MHLTTTFRALAILTITTSVIGASNSNGQHEDFESIAINGLGLNKVGARVSTDLLKQSDKSHITPEKCNLLNKISTSNQDIPHQNCDCDQSDLTTIAFISSTSNQYGASTTAISSYRISNMADAEQQKQECESQNLLASLLSLPANFSLNMNTQGVSVETNNLYTHYLLKLQSENATSSFIFNEEFKSLVYQNFQEEVFNQYPQTLNEVDTKAYHIMNGFLSFIEFNIEINLNSDQLIYYAKGRGDLILDYFTQMADVMNNEQKLNEIVWITISNFRDFLKVQVNDLAKYGVIEEQSKQSLVNVLDKCLKYESIRYDDEHLYINMLLEQIQEVIQNNEQIEDYEDLGKNFVFIIIGVCGANYHIPI